MPRIMILIVAYNAERKLASVLDRIPPEILRKVEEIAVFDDASQDATETVARDYRTRRGWEKLTIFRNQVNLMYGGNQ